MARRTSAQVAADRLAATRAKWADRYAYLKANAYLDRGSIEMLCEECGITIEQHEQWLFELAQAGDESRYERSRHASY